MRGSFGISGDARYFVSRNVKKKNEVFSACNVVPPSLPSQFLRVLPERLGNLVLHRRRLAGIEATRGLVLASRDVVPAVEGRGEASPAGPRCFAERPWGGLWRDRAGPTWRRARDGSLSGPGETQPGGTCAEASSTMKGPVVADGRPPLARPSPAGQERRSRISRASPGPLSTCAFVVLAVIHGEELNLVDAL